MTDPELTNIKKSGCGTVSRTTDTWGTTYTCKATSAGGTSTRSVTIKRDATKPVVTITTPPSSATYNAGTTGTPSFTCIEGGLGAPSGACTVTTPIDTAMAGDKTFVVTATDRAGKIQSSTVHFKVVDLTPYW